jgi:DNA-binding Xre family transcriptional regulator
MTTLRNVWEQRDMTVEDVAHAAGVSAGTVWRANRKERLYRKNLRDICRVLGITLDEYRALDPCPKAARYKEKE